MIIIQDLGQVERRYSSEGVKIRQVETNTLWNDAINVKPCRFSYEETSEPIDDVDLTEEEALAIITGVSE